MLSLIHHHSTHYIGVILLLHNPNKRLWIPRRTNPKPALTNPRESARRRETAPHTGPAPQRVPSPAITEVLSSIRNKVDSFQNYSPPSALDILAQAHHRFVIAGLPPGCSYRSG
ncbi:hypothetical protein BDP55DRAFT_361838 [Colletotrichum godetiae]|uniref:Uncharacterized protein n=1 Tax=Colletotrichum godetiae TaxID=1209918 RepID=A0AAJ0AA05_9PEZI|nr:uncharacterized protein BDP55DRAFT_361838 [Colletotrichum godetiae]KAK1659293.1 hypothetical protein BDP55DRAFT_361838 [Colletotrichum godetiae]